MCVCVSSLQENPRIEFTRTIRRRIKRQKTHRAKMHYLQYNAVYDRYDMTQPKHQLLPKLVAGFSGLLFMVITPAPPPLCPPPHPPYMPPPPLCSPPPPPLCSPPPPLCVLLFLLKPSTYVPHPPQVIVVLGIVFGVLVYRAGIAILLVSPLSKVAGSLAGTSVNLIVLVTGAGVQLIFIMIMNEVGVGGGGERVGVG